MYVCVVHIYIHKITLFIQPLSAKNTPAHINIDFFFYTTREILLWGAKITVQKFIQYLHITIHTHMLTIVTNEDNKFETLHTINKFNGIFYTHLYPIPTLNQFVRNTVILVSIKIKKNLRVLWGQKQSRDQILLKKLKSCVLIFNPFVQNTRLPE